MQTENHSRMPLTKTCLLKAELQRAFASPAASYRRVTAEEVIERNRDSRKRSSRA